MFGAIGSFLGFVVTAAVGIGAFAISREFVRQRLRFVDAIKHPLAPWVAGAGVLLVAQPFAILPLITSTTAVVAGVAAGLGTSSGVKALKSGN